MVNWFREFATSYHIAKRNVLPIIQRYGGACLFKKKEYKNLIVLLIFLANTTTYFFLIFMLHTKHPSFMHLIELFWIMRLHTFITKGCTWIEVIVLCHLMLICIYRSVGTRGHRAKCQPSILNN